MADIYSRYDEATFNLEFPEDVPEVLNFWIEDYREKAQMLRDANRGLIDAGWEWNMMADALEKAAQTIDDALVRGKR